MTKPTFFECYAGDPYFNMAFDEWMFVRAGRIPGWIGLRLYSWSPGAITIGFNQQADLAVDLAQLGQTPIIRRVTGGRALYHDLSELTYAIAINTENQKHRRLNGSASDIFAFISEMLVEFLRVRGFPADFVGRGSDESSQRRLFHKAPCFASHARYEVTSGARKIIASAQRRVGQTLFQHGSIKIGGLADHPAVPVSQWGASSASHLPAVSREVFDELAVGFRKVFEESLKVTFEASREALHTALEGLEEQLLRVRKKPLARRDIF